MQINATQKFELNNTNTTLLKTEQPQAEIQSKDTFVSSKKNSHFGEKLSKIKGKAISGATKAFNVRDINYEKRADELLEILKPGDILLTTTKNYSPIKVVEKVIGGADYTHVAIYEGDGKMIEANIDHKSGFGIDRKDVREEFRTDMMLAKIIRPPYQSQDDIDSALIYAKEQIGKPYDSFFDFESDKRMYCSELVTKALDQMPNPVLVPVRSVFNKNVAIPQDVEKIDGSEVLYDDNVSFWEFQSGMFPAFGGGLALATGVAAIGMGPIGVVGAVVAGTVVMAVASSLIRDKLSQYLQALK